MISRKYFGTDGIRGKVGGDTINAEFILRLGYAAGCVFSQQYNTKIRGKPTVLIGRDTRASGYMLESALEAGLSAAGINVLLAGLIPTPAVAYLTRALRLVAGIVISASHNTYHDNGLKFFSSQGTKLSKKTEEEIEATLDKPISCVCPEELGRTSRVNDAQGRYIEFCKSTYPNDLNLSNVKLVVDAAHGAGYNVAQYVFCELGAEVHAMGVNPDGFNINYKVGAFRPNLLFKKMKACHAHLGIVLDGDADRLTMMDTDGRIYNGDELLYAVIKERLQRNIVSGVVGTLMTNYGFEKKMQELGIGFERANVGDRHVLEQMQKRGWLYGGESSGHLICLDCHTTGDGIIAALQVLGALVRTGKSLNQWLEDLYMYPQKVVNVMLNPGADWRGHTALVTAKKSVEAELAGKGRVLIRASGTEPKLRLMVEAEDENIAQKSAYYLASSLKNKPCG